VDAANRVMHGRAGALDLHAVPGAPTGPAPAVSAFADDRAEARAIASAIRADIDGGALPESIAILYRINVQSAVLEAALGDAGVPCVIRGSTRFFDQREVKEAIMLLKGASVNTRPEPLFQTVSDVLRSLGWTQDAPEVRAPCGIAGSRSMRSWGSPTSPPRRRRSRSSWRSFSSGRPGSTNRRCPR